MSAGCRNYQTCSCDREESVDLETFAFPVVSLLVTLHSIGKPRKETTSYGNGKTKRARTFYNISVLFYRSDGVFIDYRRIS